MKIKIIVTIFLIIFFILFYEHFRITGIVERQNRQFIEIINIEKFTTYDNHRKNLMNFDNKGRLFQWKDMEGGNHFKNGLAFYLDRNLCHEYHNWQKDEL